RKKAFDLVSQFCRLTGQVARRVQELRRGFAGVACGLADPTDVTRYFLSAASRLLDISDDLRCRYPLLLDGGRNGSRDFVHRSNRRADLVDRFDRLFRGGLYRGNLLANFSRGPRGLLGERLYLRSDNGKPASGFAGTRGLDGRIQGEQVGLTCDGIDQFDNITNSLSCLGKTLDRRTRPACLINGYAGNPGRFRYLPANFPDRRCQFLSRRSDGLHVSGCLLRSGRHGSRLTRRSVRTGSKFVSRRLQALRRVADAVQRRP